MKPKLRTLVAKQAALNQGQIRQQQQQQRAESQFNANKAPTPSNDTATTATAAAQGSEKINAYFNSTVLNHPIFRGYVMYRNICLFENELSTVN